MKSAIKTHKWYFTPWWIVPHSSIGLFTFFLRLHTLISQSTKANGSTLEIKLWLPIEYLFVSFSLCKLDFHIKGHAWSGIYRKKQLIGLDACMPDTLHNVFSYFFLIHSFSTILSMLFTIGFIKCSAYIQLFIHKVSFGFPFPR